MVVKFKVDKNFWSKLTEYEARVRREVEEFLGVDVIYLSEISSRLS